MNIREYLQNKEKIKQMSRLRQKIIMTIFECGNYSTNKEIAKRCFTTENSIGHTLGLLEKEKIVKKNQIGRNSYWKICDEKILNLLKINNRNHPN